MEKIPKIYFSKFDQIEIEFEIFTLKKLFSRVDTIGNKLAEPHRVNFFHIIYITKGSGNHYIDFQPYSYKKDSILFISKGQVQSFEVADDRDGFLVLFTEEFLLKNLLHSDVLVFYRLYNYYLHRPIIQSEETGGTYFRNIIQEIFGEYQTGESYAKEEILRLLLKIVLLKAERVKRTITRFKKNSEWLNIFVNFKKCLEKRYSETRNAEEYAKMSGISYKHLNTICKSIAGNTTKKIIDDFVVMEIKRYLAISDISIKELSYEMGFDEPTNFVKFFKNQTKLTPSQFKQQLTR